MGMIGHTIELDGSFDASLDRVTEALAAEGFGVITRIDMDKTFAAKLGAEFPQYTILGACNPQLAHRALSDAPEIGLLLPCNVTVEATKDGVRVRLLDAERMIGGAGIGDSATLSALAADAGARLARVAETLAQKNQ